MTDLGAATQGLSEKTCNLILPEVYKESLFMSAKYLLGVKDLSPKTHSKVISSLEDQTTTRKLLVLPRGTFKTSIASIAYPIWMLMRNPNLRILLDSEIYSNSKNLLREIKGRVTSPPFSTLFPGWKGDPWNEGEIIIGVRTQNRKEASITCSGIGAQKTGQHYDLIIGDDLNSPKNSHTPELCEKVVSHYRMYTSLLEPGGTIVIIGTRYSSSDLIAFVLNTELGLDERDIERMLTAPHNA